MPRTKIFLTRVNPIYASASERKNFSTGFPPFLSAAKSMSCKIVRIAPHVHLHGLSPKLLRRGTSIPGANEAFDMKTMTVCQARRNFFETLSRVQFKNETILLTRFGKPVAVLAPTEVFQSTVKPEKSKGHAHG